MSYHLPTGSVSAKAGTPRPQAWALKLWDQSGAHLIFIVNAIDKLSLRGTEWLRGAAEANPEIPRAARNRLRNPMRLPRFARNDSSVDAHLFMTFTIVRSSEFGINKELIGG